MTVLMREQLNEAELAWAASDPSVGDVIAQLVRARQALGADHSVRLPGRDGSAVEPAILRAQGAL